eukprot:CAMPEP_0174841174 /NCGR_PEP_ID=MMETSP1114-20130205/9141_1 /TAXON_ID=312471 /ORGANISM="Neobodo designis, Strain CCAP 1951/1" /LENGTH=324 /DNA_ID=CAMNT_0016075353 /DNA_START=162 /DNA_END=1136 /DNA_ORIENTATION=+
MGGDPKRSGEKAHVGKLSVGGLKDAKTGFVDAAALIEAELAKTALPPPPRPFAKHCPAPVADEDLPPPAPEAAMAKADPTRVHIGNIHFGAGEGDVKRAFEKFGTINSVVMKMDPTKMRHRGFAIIEFASPDSARLVHGLRPGVISFNGLAVRVSPPEVGSGMKPDSETEFKPVDIQVSRTPVHVGPPASGKASSLAARIAANRGLRPAPALTAPGMAPGPGGAPQLEKAEPTAIVIANMIRSADEVDQQLVEEITHECGKFGRVLQVSFYASDEREGPNVAVEFATKDSAKACSTKMNGRLFDGRPLRSSILARDFYEQVRDA